MVPTHAKKDNFLSQTNQ